MLTALIAAAASAVIAMITLLYNSVAAGIHARRRRKQALVALEAEIQQKLRELENTFQVFETVAQICARMEADPTFVPYIALEPYAAPVFDRLGAEIFDLSRDVVHSVVAFYAADRAAHAAFSDLASPRFAQLDAPRRSNLWRAIPAIRGAQIITAQEALEALRHALGRRPDDESTPQPEAGDDAAPSSGDGKNGTQGHA